MEKSQEGLSEDSAHRVSGIAYLKLLGLLAIFGLTLGRVRTFPQPHITTNSSGVSWFQCPDSSTHECAYLAVPMDYELPNSNETVLIFLRKLPAPRTEGTPKNLLIEPGGPGSSGNDAVFSMGWELSEILDGRFNIIGFDPRGVNMTLPPIYCHPTESQSVQYQAALQHLGIPFEARHSAPLAGAVSVAEALESSFLRKYDTYLKAAATACVTNGDQAMLRSVSTSLVAKDMKRIMEALGDDGLSYWGVSYGTIVGATFAAMYPNSVHRFVLDGVSNAQKYHQNVFDWGRSGLQDTNKTYQGLFDSCAEAGPQRCALATSTDTTSRDIHDRVEALYTRLARHPIAVPSSAAGTGILTASDIKLFVFMGLYSPKRWPSMAQGLVDAENGNGQTVYESLYSLFANYEAKNATDNVFNHHVAQVGTFLSTVAIMCGDSEFNGYSNISDTDLSVYLDYVHDLEELSPIGQNWAQWQGFCRHWPIKARDAYRGPWSIETGLKKTKFPILFVSQTADPVTPLEAAMAMAKSFGNDSATLLIQNGFGHCSSAHPSLCTAKKIRAYLLQGVVPEYGTQCEVEPGFLFPADDQAASHMDSLSLEDNRLLQAMYSLSSKLDKYTARVNAETKK